jgi:hypothetical protein
MPYFVMLAGAKRGKAPRLCKAAAEGLGFRQMFELDRAASEPACLRHP